VESTCWITKAPRTCSQVALKRIWKPKIYINSIISTVCKAWTNHPYNSKNNNLQNRTVKTQLEIQLMHQIQTLGLIQRLTARRNIKCQSTSQILNARTLKELCKTMKRMILAKNTHTPIVSHIQTKRTNTPMLIAAKSKRLAWVEVETNLMLNLKSH
jgi:hypothetical protein